MKYALPSWLLTALGEPRQEMLLWTDSKRFILSAPNKDDIFFDDFEKAFDSVPNSNLRLDSSICNELGVYFGPPNASGSGRLFMVRNDNASLEALEDAFFEHVEHYKRYNENPNDFMNAYEYIDTHVALWTRMEPDAPIADQFWETDERLSKASIYPYRRGSSYSFQIEFGETAPPEHTHTYFDPTLSDQAPSYEELVIAAAAILHENFWPTGERKESLSSDAFYEKFNALEKLRVQNLSERLVLENPYS